MTIKVLDWSDKKQLGYWVDMSILCNLIFCLIFNLKLKEIQILNIPTIPVLWSLFKKGFSTNYLCVPLCHYYSADTSTLVVWRRTRTRGGKPYRPSCLSAFLTTLSSVSLHHHTAPHSVSIFFWVNNLVLGIYDFDVVTGDNILCLSIDDRIWFNQPAFLNLCLHFSTVLLLKRPQDDDAQDDDAGESLAFITALHQTKM